ncbi:Solute-binding protein family 5 domain [Acididesulfobacillus acetoxydans]|uniref:Heme-binding protein A n=1 Tax=Acididesulfobacillus acetoxydans TaxID=1561005 RepID=A0A8S0Y3K4_9FIRM|nr:ABC transporter substrate-binding protein [Acididesulfobacillus acetoxydans]CAA7602165.1 Solute-binding protein family 5 domain [Acididesulfobacillus acetoxydans]CEJ08721.1 Heme-binding protein A [Acididesulfobacillus acetoxydans]
MKKLGTKKSAVAGVLAASLLIVSVLSGCGQTTAPQAQQQSASSSATPQMGGVLRTWKQYDPKSLDPTDCGDTDSYDIQQNIYDGLVMWDKSGKEIVPDLATALPTITNGGKTYTFQLRQGVTFQNGDPFTAADVVYSFNREASKSIASPGESYFSMIKGMDDVFAGKAATVSGVVEKGKYTVEFDLTQPTRTFLDVLAMPYAFIVDKKYTSALPNQGDLSLHPIGTGPFMFKEWKKGQVIKLVRNPHYFLKDAQGRQLPYMDGITWTLGYGNSVAYLKFKDKKQDFSLIPTSDYVSTLNDPNMKNDITSLVENDYFYIGGNIKKAPWNNKLVRQAMEYAIDKDALVKLYNKRIVPAWSILPPNMPGYQENPSGYKYDPAKAKELLKQAGYPNGLPGVHPMVYVKNDIRDVLAANIQAQLAAVGIKISLDGVPFPKYLDVVTKGQEDMVYGGWMQDYPDPDDFLNILFNSNQIPSNNNVGYSNPAVDKQLNQLASVTDLQKAIPGYQAVEKQILDDAAIVPLYHDKEAYLIQPWVHNSQLHPVYPYFYYWTMWIDQKAEQAATKG